MGMKTLNITFARSNEVGNRNYYIIVVEGLPKIPPGRDVSRHPSYHAGMYLDTALLEGLSS